VKKVITVLQTKDYYESNNAMLLNAYNTK